MKIVGGSFGVKGKARFSGKYLEVLGDKTGEYKPADVAEVNVRTEKERKFGILGAIIGFFLIGWLLSQFMSTAGWLVALVLAIAGSFYSTKQYFGDLKFSDGSTVTLQTNDYEAQKLVKFPDL